MSAEGAPSGTEAHPVKSPGPHDPTTADEETAQLLTHWIQHVDEQATPQPGTAADAAIHPPAPARPPLWAWALLCASLLAVSSAGTVFSMMRDVPPVTLAAWRLQATSVLLAVGAGVQWRALPPARRAAAAAAAPLLAGSGTSLAVHFGCWVASVELTSLTHSLLFVSATPVLLATWAWARRAPISAGELWGTALGFVGTAVLASSAGSEAEVTLKGDALALTASAAFVPYLLIGRRLRAWMPLFVYAAPVTGLAAAELTVAALATGAHPAAAGAAGAFGWLASPRFFPLILYLGIVPGIVGHTGINALLRYLDPLIITLVLNAEPLVGSILGYLAGVTAAPGALTYVGGALVLASTALVSVAAGQREAAARRGAVATGEVEAVYVGTLDENESVSDLESEQRT